MKLNRRWIVMISIFILLILVGIIIYLNRSTNSKLDANSYLIHKEANIHIDGVNVYKNISDEGCYDQRISFTHKTVCGYRLDLFYRGTGDYARDYLVLITGLQQAGFDCGGIHLDPFRLSKFAIPANINGAMCESGMIDGHSSNVFATPIFVGTGINKAATQGIYSSPKSPANLNLDNGYVYGVTIHRLYKGNYNIGWN